MWYMYIDLSYKFTCILFGVISLIKMVLHSERIILLSMFYKAYINVYYFYYSIKVLVLCLG